MQTEDLQAFLAVAEHHSLTAAARELGIPKSTISRRLTRLEQTLELQLVLRSARKTQITELGRQLQQRASPLLAELGELGRHLREQGAEPRGRLRVTAPEDLATVLLGPLVGRVLLAHPGLEIELLASNQRVDLLAEGIDVAFRIHFAQLPPVTGLKLRGLGHVEFGLYAAPSYLDQQCRPRRPDDLSAHPCLTMASVGRRWPLVHSRSGQTVRVEFRPSLLSNDHHALRDATIAGAGIGLAPSFLCHDAVEGGALVRVLPRWSVERATLSMLWPATRQRSPRVQAFVELATRYFKDGGYFVRRR